MKVWVTSFILLFGLAELYQWISHVTVPLPLFILGGVGLAIASNYDKRAGLPIIFQPEALEEDDDEAFEDEDEDEDDEDFPDSDPPAPPVFQRSVSFTIPKYQKPQ